MYKYNDFYDKGQLRTKRANMRLGNFSAVLRRKFNITKYIIAEKLNIIYATIHYNERCDSKKSLHDIFFLLKSTGHNISIVIDDEYKYDVDVVDYTLTFNEIIPSKETVDDDDVKETVNV